MLIDSDKYTHKAHISASNKCDGRIFTNQPIWSEH